MVTRLNDIRTRISVNEETEGNFTPVHHQSTAMTLSTFNDPISNYTEPLIIPRQKCVSSMTTLVFKQELVRRAGIVPETEVGSTEAPIIF